MGISNKHNAEKLIVEQSQLDVLLISMPFGPIFTPSIGLSLLKEGLKKNSVDVSIKYFSIEYAALIGSEEYTLIASNYPDSMAYIGEWIFSHLVSESKYTEEDYVNFLKSYVDIGKPIDPHKSQTSTDINTNDFIELCRKLRSQSESFIDKCLVYVLHENPSIVGFTSTFHQHTSSLALAKKIKDISPKTKIVMGGANCETIMGAEIVRQFSFVDVVVSGYADNVFPDIVKNLLKDEELPFQPGVFTRRNNSIISPHDYSRALEYESLDALPLPTYDDYVDQCSQAFGESKNSISFMVPVETSRGCWWGQKHHCTFCGLNGDDMSYRSKSPKRAIMELNAFISKY